MKFSYNPIKRHMKNISDPDFLIFSKREIVLIIVFVIVGGLMSFIPKIPSLERVVRSFFIFVIIILTNFSVKKIISSYYAIKIEHNVLELERYGFKESKKFKKPVKIGFITILISIISFGYIKPFTFFQFDYENIPEKRILKASGSRRAVRKEQINEEDLANTSASGFYALIFIAVIGLLIKPFFPEFGVELAKYSIYYGIWNMLPIGQLDGAKLFFGTKIIWYFILMIHILIGLMIIFIR